MKIFRRTPKTDKAILDDIWKELSDRFIVKDVSLSVEGHENEQHEGIIILSKLAVPSDPNQPSDAYLL